MLNIDSVEHIYLAVGVTDLRKSIDGLSAIVSARFKLDVYDNTLYVFCNRKRDKLKILHWDNGFWLYYHRIEKGYLKWPMNEHQTINISLEEFNWILKGYEVRTHNKLRISKGKNHY